jgi:hypothetical protein
MFDAHQAHECATVSDKSSAGSRREHEVDDHPHAIKRPNTSAVGLQQVYLDSVDNLRLDDARPPVVPPLFQGSAVLVRICSPSGPSVISAEEISSAW